MMKITRSTNITSTSGMMLISDMGVFWSLLKPPNAMGSASFSQTYHLPAFLGLRCRHRKQLGVEVMGKSIQLCGNQAVLAVECMVSEYRRQRRSQTCRSSHQRLPHGTGHRLEIGISLGRNAHQGVVNPPDRPEQADKRCRTTYGRHDRQSRLQAHGCLAHSIADRPHQKLIQTTGSAQGTIRIGVVMAPGINTGTGHMGDWQLVVFGQLVGLVQILTLPELLQKQLLSPAVAPN